MKDLQIHPHHASHGEHQEKSPLALGTEALERGDLSGAETHFGKALLQDSRRPEPWYWLGRVKEEQGNPKAAAYGYFWAWENCSYLPAKESLKRLGYLKAEKYI